MFIINGEVWHLKIVSSFHPMLQRPDGNYAVGACDNVYKSIYLSEELYGKFFQTVLAHEIAHAAMLSYDIVLDSRTEELIANLIANYGQEIITITNKLFKDIQMGYL